MSLTLKDPTLKTILVTGANRGIGLETVRQLVSSTARKSNSKNDVPSTCAAMNVIATARNPDQASELKELQQKHQDSLYVEALDLASSESRVSLQKRLNCIRLDVLINNAGIYSGGKNPVNDALTMMSTNYFGTKKLSHILRPNLLLAAETGLVINVSSGMGELSGFASRAQRELLDSTLNENQLDEMVHRYCKATSPSVSMGWPSDPYSASKGALNAWTRIAAKSSEFKSMVSLCPGWVRTDMGGSSASRSVQEGADTVVWLATSARPTEVNGKFYRDRREIDW